MFKRFLILIPLLFFMSPAVLIAQETYELEEQFLDADSWYYYEDYREALPLFMKVLDAEPDNYNVNYKIGICYLNIPGQKEKSIPYLEKATEGTTSRYRENVFSEKEAPIDAYFYLGNAYLINNDFRKAKNAYQTFRNKIEENKGILNLNKEEYNKEYLAKQIKSCEIAERERNNPQSFVASNLGNPINTRFSELTPVISGDGESLVFTAQLQFYDAIFYVKKNENGEWGFPINLMGQLAVDDNTHPTSLSYDGTEMYLYRDDNFDGNIYVSNLKEDGMWSKVRKLGENINTKYWESHAAISPAGKKLYFTSNREGGYGDLDIYVSEKTAGGIWGPAKNLGDVINTQWNENTPFLVNDGKTLYFSSEGHKSMGGYDIFVSNKNIKNNWTQPYNVGYPVNSTDDDLFFTPTRDGKSGYYAQFTDRGYGGRDIFYLQLSNIPQPPAFRVEKLHVMDNEQDRNTQYFQLVIIDTKTNDTLAVLDPDDPAIEDYTTESGNYHIVYESRILDKNGEQIYLSQNYEIKERFLESVELKEPEDSPELATVPKIKTEKDEYNMEGAPEQEVKIKLSLEQGNKLFVTTFVDEKVLNTEEFDIKDESFIYEFTPVEGQSQIEFKLLDAFNNEKTKLINVNFNPLDQDAKLAIQDQTIDISKGQKKVKIKLSLEKDSKLYVETYMDDELINKESFDINKENFVYEYEPKKGKSKLNFRLVDKYNNVRNEEVVISHQPIEEDLSNLLKEIAAYKQADINTVIESIKLENISNTQALIEAFYERGKTKGFSSDELDALLIAAFLLESKDGATILQNLNELATGEIKTALDSLVKTKRKFQNSEEILLKLRELAPVYGYTQDDITELIRRYFVQHYGKEKLYKILSAIGKIDPREYLQNLDASALDITTSEELISLLSKQDIADKETMKLLEAIMKAKLLSGKIDLESSIPEVKPKTPADEEEQSFMNLLIYFVLGFVAIGVIILYFNRRKKRKMRR